MLKAKAKAAATAAAQKRKAAAAAAAAQEAAAQQAAAAASGMGIPSTTRSGRGIRPNVTQYWADSASNILAPGGSIQRIGYDQTAFEEALRVVVFGEEARAEGEPGALAAGSEAGLVERPGKRVFGEDGTVVKVGEEGEKEEKEAEEEQAEGEKYKTNKEDLATVLSALDVPSALASQSLRSHKGDLAATLRDLSAPKSTIVAA
ncbi:hypothetical protein JCM6882_006487 [Rhodosporidiobolus microsporus]